MSTSDREHQAGQAVRIKGRRVIFVQRKRCPNPLCRSLDLLTYDSEPSDDGEIVTQKIRCRACGEKFVAVIDG